MVVAQVVIPRRIHISKTAVMCLALSLAVQTATEL